MKIFFTFFFLALFSSAFASEFPRNYFISPVEFAIRLSANFGELRTNAFHAGIDLRTNGRTGLPIRASAEGFVYRIRVSPVGYGRALYIEHPNGLATVYAHLDEFSEEIEKYVKEAQYRQQSFDVDLRPPAGRLRVKKGEFIGYSGNTGSSFGPHLHYEIRDAATQMPINPLLFDFEINDNLPPVLYTLAIYPLSQKSLVNGKNETLYLPLSGGRGRYDLPNNSRIEVFGNIGFGIEATDFLNDSPNRCGAWSIELLLDNNRIYRHELTRFAFGELRYINSHIDYAEKIRNRRDIQRMFLQPNNHMSIYDMDQGRGTASFYEEGDTDVRVIVKDAYKNRSELSFRIYTGIPGEETLPPPPPPDFRVLMPYDRANRFSDNGAAVTLPAGSLYDDLMFEFKTSPAQNGSIVPVYHIHNIYTPVHRNYNLSIAAPDIPETLREKALMVNLNGPGNSNNNNNISPVNSQWSNGHVHGRANVFGRFTVMLDTVPPSIEPLNTGPGRDMSNQRLISFRVRDNLSGIKSYAGFIDNEWALFEYDPKNDHLFYVFDKERIGTGETRNLEIFLMDEKDNITVYQQEFFY